LYISKPHASFIVSTYVTTISIGSFNDAVKIVKIIGEILKQYDFEKIQDFTYRANKTTEEYISIFGDNPDVAVELF
jgi:hypothetical protein